MAWSAAASVSAVPGPLAGRTLAGQSSSVPGSPLAFLAPPPLQLPALAVPLASPLRRLRRGRAAVVPLAVLGEGSSDGGSAGSSSGPAVASETVEQSTPQNEPDLWSWQMGLSVMSGLIGSMLSATAFSRQREASKGKLRSPSSLSGIGSSASARIVQQLGGSLLDAEAQSPLFSLGPVPRCTAASDLRRNDRHFTIITTAALPWLTGTAVNPLLRALNLARHGRPVVLVVPWLEVEDQAQIFAAGQTFASKDEQEETIFKWCRERAKIDPAVLPLKIRWYGAKYVHNVRSIFPSGDPALALGQDDPRDVLILEEPEHLCWYHHGTRWPELFRHVVGIIHTNYQDYLIQKKDVDLDSDYLAPALIPDEIKEASVFAATTWVCSAYCDVNIKLSSTIMPLPNEVTCNVHGCRDEFLEIGDMCGKPEHQAGGAYYLGKASLQKGWGELLELLEKAGPLLEGLHIDGYGSGADQNRILKSVAALEHASLKMSNGIDHANEVIHPYSVLINASTSDVLCTVNVEALAMGKRCVLARHPSNNFFEEHFSNRCHFFEVGDAVGFANAVKNALAAGPAQQLPDGQRHALTWDAACERLFCAAEVRVLSGRFQRPSEAAASRLAYRLHHDTMKDRLILDVIKGATLGTKTPWGEYLNEWRREGLGKLKVQARLMEREMRPDHLLEHERYIMERIKELAGNMIPNSPSQRGRTDGDTSAAARDTSVSTEVTDGELEQASDRRRGS
mmetsp:Transcript_87628/g.281203  ORF Transcript_87628/g.281203 Transcript_87628/m.281203 type:complete len:736 (-) Transcript_87628:155-2362(-)